ncbi:acyl-coenzyme A synthetase ACSM3 [Verticillium alfalfae VaMs.102]|uniref:medium-chain acyl-CoA ligase n=1 Tax=Verticillium alfalfae (strain VaMs.102 / ATCC MYA-4576 / FGSC 10136) TaxID=526221 RepID=C9SUI6_VERA1|nr:acyl-coenzyme A synthetase ACSM3 [Verticillium alfalfae VaMs.102]EEY22497.1 acyl-coenzyme A synthetase ACSM3 [Verticillium alfalfae VaMs.102]
MTANEIAAPLGPLTNSNFAIDVVDAQALSTPDRQAMLWTDDESRTLDLSFRYFSQKSHSSAQLLNDLGIQKGDILMILLPRVPAWWEIATGALRAGIVVSPCTTLATHKDMAFRAQASKAAAFIGDTETITKFLRVRDNCPSMRTILQADGLPVPGIAQYDELIGTYDPDVRYLGDQTKSTDPAFLFFTSGTTGPPKMVVHNHLYPLGHVPTGQAWLLLGPGKLYWSLAEQGWAKAAWAWFAAWNTGAALFVQKMQGAFSPQSLVETLHKYPITTLCAPPTAFRRLVLPETRALIQDLPPLQLEHCVAAGEALEGELVRTWASITSIEIKDGYGQTETTLLCGNFPGNKVKLGSMGLPTPGTQLCVVDNNGDECDAGEEGDIAVATHDIDGAPLKGIYDGYLQADGTTSIKLQQETHPKEGRKPRQWYLTGDRAKRDGEGYFWFIGRADDVINSAGYRIGPSEVEAVLQEHPAVLESIVIASPSAERGDVVKAFIVLTDAAKNDDLVVLAKKIQDHCKETAAPYKYPRRIEFVGKDFFPRTVSGKVQRAKLRERERSQQTKAKI